MRYILMLTVLSLVCFVFIISCAKPQGTTPSEKRQYILNMEEQTMAELYARRPESKVQVDKSAGYAVFSNINTQLLFFGGGNGYGVAVDRSTGKKTYMRMLQASAGIGVALKDFREVMIFRNAQSFRNFVTKGWDMSVQAGAGAKTEEQGGAESGAISVSEDIITYHITSEGIELRTNVAGKKYWQDNELNYN